MANYHTNDLAIAADTENMKKVLLNFAANLAANSEETEFGLYRIAGIESVQGIYKAIKDVLSWHYEFAFSGAPIDEELPSDDSLGWESSTSSASGYASQVEAMKGFASRLQSTGVNIKLESLPSGRPLSDEASVGLTRYGDRWVIRLMYSTGWEPNSRELSLFFLGLPEGEYGVAFLDADEYDDYETISVFSGVHHGRALLHDMAKERENEDVSKYELWELRKKCRLEGKGTIDDLAYLAFNHAASWWEDWGSWEEPYEERVNDDGGESWIEKPLTPSYNWENPNEDEFAEIRGYALNAFSKFPIEYDVEYETTGWGYPGQNQNIEYFVPGSEVRLKSDWNDLHFKYVGIEVFDKEGRFLGNVWSFFDPKDDVRAVLACLLPHIHATVVNVEMQGSRGDLQKRDHLVIRLELEPIDFPVVLEEMRSLLKLDLEKRSLFSAVSEEE